MNETQQPFRFCGCTERFLRRGRPSAWHKRHLLWSIVDYLPGIEHSVLEAVYCQAFKHWSDVCGLTFEQSDRRDADYLVSTRPIDGEGGTLAESQLPNGTDRQIRAWMDNEHWDTAPPIEPETIDLGCVSCHEFGHGIGLDHLRQPDNLMNAFYNPSIRTPQAADIAEAQRRYGKPVEQPAPTPEADYPVGGTILMASGAEYPILVGNNEKWGEG